MKDEKMFTLSFNSLKLDVFFIILSIVLGFIFQWSIPEIIIFTIFIWSILNPIDSKYLSLAALIFLAITPFLLIFKQQDWAEQSAIYAYYFLVFTVIMALYELKKEDKASE